MFWIVSLSLVTRQIAIIMTVGLNAKVMDFFPEINTGKVYFDVDCVNLKLEVSLSWVMTEAPAIEVIRYKESADDVVFILY